MCDYLGKIVKKKLDFHPKDWYICARFEKSYVSDRLNEFVAFFMPTINGGEHDR